MLYHLHRPRGYRGLEVYILSTELLLSLVDECASRDQYSLRRDVLQARKDSLKLQGYIWSGFAAQIRSVQEYYDRSMQLLDPASHLGYLDQFGGCQPLLESYQEAYRKWHDIRREMDKLQMDEAERSRRVDTLNYQIQELEDWLEQRLAAQEDAASWGTALYMLDDATQLDPTSPEALYLKAQLRFNLDAPKRTTTGYQDANFMFDEFFEPSPDDPTMDIYGEKRMDWGLPMVQCCLKDESQLKYMLNDGTFNKDYRKAFKRYWKKLKADPEQCRKILADLAQSVGAVPSGSPAEGGDSIVAGQPDSLSADSLAAPVAPVTPTPADAAATPVPALTPAPVPATETPAGQPVTPVPAAVPAAVPVATEEN